MAEILSAVSWLPVLVDVLRKRRLAESTRQGWIAKGCPAPKVSAIDIPVEMFLNSCRLKILISAGQTAILNFGSENPHQSLV